MLRLAEAPSWQSLYLSSTKLIRRSTRMTKRCAEDLCRKDQDGLSAISGTTLRRYGSMLRSSRPTSTRYYSSGVASSTTHSCRQVEMQLCSMLAKVMKIKAMNEAASSTARKNTAKVGASVKKWQPLSYNKSSAKAWSKEMPLSWKQNDCRLGN